MPKGKLNNKRGSVIYRPSLPETINEQTLLPYKKNGHPDICQQDYDSIKDKIRSSLEIYIGKHNAQTKKYNRTCITITHHKDEIKKIRIAAKRLLEEKTDQSICKWKKHLRTLFKGKEKPVSLTTRDMMHRRLRRFDFCLFKLLKELENKSTILPPQFHNQLTILSLNEQDWKNMLVEKHGQNDAEIYFRSTRQTTSTTFTDPFLFELVNALIPIWRGATGRSIKPTSLDATGDVKKHHFAEWLIEMLNECNHFPLPKYGTILDIINHQKK